MLATQKGSTNRPYINYLIDIYFYNSSFDSYFSQFKRYFWESSWLSLWALKRSIKNLLNYATSASDIFWIGLFDKDPKGWELALLNSAYSFLTISFSFLISFSCCEHTFPRLSFGAIFWGPTLSTLLLLFGIRFLLAFLSIETLLISNLLFYLVWLGIFWIDDILAEEVFIWFLRYSI